jgi:predicted ATPase/class 3 adenylate cyclase
VTFLFTDIEGSTSLWDAHPDEMAKALARHDAILRNAVESNGGQVVNTTGDGLFAAFSRAQQALATAVSAQRELSDETWPEPIRVSVRMGMHTGEAVERDGDYFGPAVIRASRLMSAVSGGRIVCSLATAELVRSCLPGQVELVPAGTLALKGLSLPEQVFVVRGVGLPETGELIESPLRQGVRPPRGLSRLVGREGELEDVATLVLPGGLVTLTGVGGVGKTRLAMAAAELTADKWSDGTCWAELAPAANPADVVQAVADAVGVAAQPGQPLTPILCEALRGRRALIVLDNCEHVRAATADVAAAIQQRCAGVALLATSRERLAVDGERVVAVTPLAAGGPETPAVELLVERIDHPGRLSHDDTITLVEVAQRLDGLPLALELAAARCRTLGVPAVAARLRDHLDLLADRTRQTQRHRTLEATLAWSYDLLSPVEQRVLQRLSVFAASFTLDAAEQVAGTAKTDALAVDDTVSSLVDKSLIVRDGSRFALLETTGQFAAHRLTTSGQRRSTEQAHTCFVAARMPVIHTGLHGPDEELWVHTLDIEWPDVRAGVRRAFDTDNADAVIEILVYLGLEILYRRPEAFPWVNEAVARWADRAGPHRHELLGLGAVAAYTQLDVQAAVGLAERAIAADPSPGTALDYLPEAGMGGAMYFSGQLERALETYRQHFDSVMARGSRWCQAISGFSLAVALLAVGSTTEAGAIAAQTLQLATKTGNPTAIAAGTAAYAGAISATDPAAAAALLEHSRAMAAKVRNQWLITISANTMQMTEATGSTGADALLTLVEAADELHRTGWATHAWWALWSAPARLHRLGRREEGALVLGGCEASGIARLSFQVLPGELELLVASDSPDDLQVLRSLGAGLTLPDLLRIIRGQQPIPGRKVA